MRLKPPYSIFWLALFALMVGLSEQMSASLLADETMPAESTMKKVTAESEADVDFSTADVAAAQQFGMTLGIADWLGPLAPVALSPFFGICCLSGMALYGQGWVSADNAFLGEASPLHNENVFVAFLILTVITSIPRLTKVSKPFAQAIDQVEAWAGFITLITLKLMLSADASDAEPVAMVQMGVVSFSVDTLLLIAAGINIFVINAVKFFFEMLIWITPVPAIDAVFEAANKTLCGVLMLVYGYSPTIATMINLAMFVMAAFVFRWAYRRQVFFRTVLLDALVAFFVPPKTVTTTELVVFPASEVDVIPARARCHLQKTESGWTLTQQRLLRKNVAVELLAEDSKLTLNAGFFTNSLRLTGTEVALFTFSRRYNDCLPELAEVFGASLDERNPDVTSDQSGLRAELT